MHITPEFAGLVAQVFPTLLIALVLEGRFGPANRLGRWVNVVHHWIRFLAILGTAASTFACLSIARTGVGEEFTDWLVSITSYLLLTAVCAMAGTVLADEREKVFTDFKALRPKPKGPQSMR